MATTRYNGMITRALLVTVSWRRPGSISIITQQKSATMGAFLLEIYVGGS